VGAIRVGDMPAAFLQMVDRRRGAAGSRTVSSLEFKS